MSESTSESRSPRQVEENIPLTTVNDPDSSPDEPSTPDPSNNPLPSSSPSLGDPSPSNPSSADLAHSDPSSDNPAPVDPSPSDPSTNDPSANEPSPDAPSPDDPSPDDPTPDDPSPDDPSPDAPSPDDPSPDDPSPPDSTSDVSTDVSPAESDVDLEGQAEEPDAPRDRAVSRFQQAFYWLKMGGGAASPDAEESTQEIPEEIEQSETENIEEVPAMMTLHSEETIAPVLSDETIAPVLSDENIAPVLSDETIAPVLSGETIAPVLPDETMDSATTFTSVISHIPKEPSSAAIDIQKLSQSSLTAGAGNQEDTTQELLASGSSTEPIQTAPTSATSINKPRKRVEFDGSASPSSDVSVDPSSSSTSSQPQDVVIDIEPKEPGGKTAEAVRNLWLSMPSKLEKQKSLHIADIAKMAIAANTLRKKPKRRKAVVGIIHGRTTDDLLDDDDFVDAPTAIQAANIRGITTTLHEKKKFMNHLHRGPSGTKQRPGCCKRTGWTLSIAWAHFKQHAAEFRYSLELWSNHIKKIEGHFGTGVTSYFRFLRTLFYLNVFVMVLLVSFITVPQILFRFFKQEPRGYAVNVPFNASDILTGGGWFENTELYYGFHHHGVITVVGGFNYDMRYAYLLTNIFYYLLTVIMLAAFLSRSYRQHYIEEKSTTCHFSTVKVFCGWDYKISNRDAGSMQHNAIYKELQEYMVEYHMDTEKRSCRVMCALVLLRMVANLFVIGLLGGAGYLVWFISITQSLSNEYGILSEMAMPLCISAINIIVPFAFSIISHFEKYKSPRVELVLTMLRTIMLNLVTLGVLIFFWYSSVDCRNTKDSTVWMDAEVECKPCWENFMGEQLYRLIIVDFAFTVIITIFSEFIRRLMTQFCYKNMNPPGFNIARNTLNLIYSQILVWLGAFYSPLLSVIHLIKLILIFYIKRISVVQNCSPPSKPWKAGQTSTFIQFLLFAAYLTTFVAVAYGLVFINPSEVCGPYQEHNTTYQVLEELLDLWKATDSGNLVKSIIEVVTSIAFLAFVIIGMAVAAYYSQVVAQAHRENVKKLRNQIILEGKDKKFLLRLLQQAQGNNTVTAPKTLPTNNIRTSQNETKLGAVRRCSEPDEILIESWRRTEAIPEATESHLDSSSAQSSRSPSLIETHNDSYQENSLETQAILMAEGHRRRTPTRSHEAQNPTYRENSPNRLPDLPYPTQPYNTMSP